jgi:hypothetical protein
MSDPRALTPADASRRPDHDPLRQVSRGLVADAVNQPALLNGFSPRHDRQSTITQAPAGKSCTIDLRLSVAAGGARQVGLLVQSSTALAYTPPNRRDPPMADKQLILAVFPDELAADNAAVALKDSGITEGDAVGILVLDSDGELKQDKVGARSTGKGAAIGGVLLLLGPAALGVGIIGGAAAGALHHKSLGLSDADKARLTTELTAGKAAVGVLADFDTAPAISDRLTELGGASEAHELSDEAVQAAAAGAPAA